MKKIFKMLHTEEHFLRFLRHNFPLSMGPILGNVIGSHYYLSVAYVSTDLIGIAIYRN